MCKFINAGWCTHFTSVFLELLIKHCCKTIIHDFFGIQVLYFLVRKTTRLTVFIKGVNINNRAATSIAIFPTLQYIYRNNELLREAVPLLAYSITGIISKKKPEYIKNYIKRC